MRYLVTACFLMGPLLAISAIASLVIYLRDSSFYHLKLGLVLIVLFVLSVFIATRELKSLEKVVRWNFAFLTVVFGLVLLQPALIGLIHEGLSANIFILFALGAVLIYVGLRFLKDVR